MAGAAEIRAGRAFVELYLKNSLAKGLSGARKQLDVFAKSATMAGQKLLGVGGTVTAIGATMLSAFAAPIAAAGDLMETVSKFGAVFGDQAPQVQAWADTFRNAVGRSKKDVYDGLSTFQAFFQGLNFGSEEAAGFSKELTALAVDFASFHNMQDPEAMQRFISALSGSGEVLSMYGVNIMEAALNQQLLAMGFPTIAKGATEAQKVLARMAIIKDTMGRQGAVGDAVRTADSFSNQMKKLRGTLADTAAEIGGALLPVVTPLVAKTGEIVKRLAEWARLNPQVIQTVAKVAVGITAAGIAITIAGGALVGLGMGITGLLSAVSGLGAALAFVASPLGLISAALIGGVAAWAMWTESGRQATDVISKALGGITDALLAGDWQLAGKIAMAGLQVAFIAGVNAITQSMGTLGTVFSQIITGDLQGAWSTAVQSMAHVWDVFAFGVATAFQEATDAVRRMFIGVTAGINASMIAMEAYLKSIGQASAAEAVGAARVGIVAASGSASSSLSAISSASDAVAGALAGKANASARGVAAANSANAAAQDAALLAAQAELDSLLSEASRKRKQEIDAGRNAVDGAAAGVPAALAGGGGSGGGSFGSFSAAALGLVGNGGIQQQQLAELKKARKEAEEQKKQNELLRQAVKDNQLMVLV